jgi:hypothetical protein
MNTDSTKGEIDLNKIGPKPRGSAHVEREQAEKEAMARLRARARSAR